jgi:cytochrome c biogenesis protein CcmG/thiol:disulfide interchange protein DsbE
VLMHSKLYNLFMATGFKLGLLFLFLAVPCCNSNIRHKNKIYYCSDHQVITSLQFDSIFSAKSKKFKTLGFELKKVILDKRISGDSVIYDYTLKANSKGVVDNTHKYTAFIGKPLPAFSARDLVGTLIESKKLVGQPMVINMWFTTCVPCINEMPELNKLRNNPKNSGIKFIAMTFEPKIKVSAFLKHTSFNFVQLPDQKAYCNKFTDNYPITIFVNRDGIIQDIQEGMAMIFDSKRKAFTTKADAESFNSALKKL